MNRFEMIKRNLPYCLFIVYIIKCIAIGTNWSDFAAIPFLLLLACFFEYQPKNKEVQELSNKVADLEQKSQKYDKDLIEMNKKIEGIRTVTGMKQAYGGR